jgi:hypothetical protein
MGVYSTSVIPLGIEVKASALDFPTTGIDGQQLVAADTNTIYIYQSSAPAGWKPVANPGAAIAIDGLTGDVTATGPGVVAATVAKIGGVSVVGATGTTNVVFSDNPTFSTGITLTSLTANQILASSLTQGIVSLTTATYPSLTELSYLKGVSSSVQTQLNNKQPYAAVVRITKSANYNLSATDDYIGCNTFAGSFTLSLPAANSVSSGKLYIVKDEYGACTINPLLIAPNGADKIDGVNASYSLNVNFESVTLVCNGADSWFII